MPRGHGDRFGLARVVGRSMEPTLRPGDRLVVCYGPPTRLLRPGRLVVVRLPAGAEGPRPTAVKRLAGRDPSDPGKWWVERDNPREGVDSWLVGGIPEPDLLAVVLGRLPRWLRGRLGTRPVTPDHDMKG